MVNRPAWLPAILLLALVAACGRQPPAASHYDAGADPFAALERAETEARASGKKVLLIAGGDWCPWCVELESFISGNPDVKTALDQAMVTVEVYYGDKNPNRAFFARLPPAQGYPHFWVISRDGKVLHSVNTGLLENGRRSYDREKFLYFIREIGREPG